VKVDGLHPRKSCQPANSFMDWDKVIVLDGSSSHSFHAKPISESIRSPEADSRWNISLSLSLYKY